MFYLRRLLCVLTLSCALAGSACAARQVTVKSFSPEGLVEESRPVISVVFSGDVVKKSQLNKRLRGSQSPLFIHPAVEGYAKWVAPFKLYYITERDLEPSTSYVADFGPGGLKTASGGLVAGPQSFTFTSRPVSFDSVSVLGVSSARNVTLGLNFSSEVSPVRLKGFLHIFNEKGKEVSYTVRGESPARRIKVDTLPVYGRKVRVEVDRGLLPDDGNLPTEENRWAEIDISCPTIVTGSRARGISPERGAIRVEMNNSVEPAQARGFVSLVPDMPFTLGTTWDGFEIYGDFLPGSRVKVILRKGLKAENCDPMVEDFEKTFVIPDLEPEISFPAAGMFLTPAEEPLVALECLNTERLRVTARKFYSNNLPIATLASDSGGDDARWMKKVGRKFFRVGGTKNETVRRALNLRSLGCDGEGVYLIDVADAESSWRKVSMLVNITDTALSVRRFNRGLQLWAASISTARPVPGGTVKVFDGANQLLFEGVTDESGLVSFTRDTPFEEDNIPSIATFEHEGVLSFVKLGVNQLEGRDIDTSGAGWPEGYEGVWLLPRSLWQPGETLEAKALVRTPSLDLPGEFPLTWSLSSRGVTSADGMLTLDSEGCGSISVPIPPSIMSGTYTLSLSVPGNAAPLARTRVQIEEFRPPQVESELSLPERFVSGEENRISMSSRYLFGAPGADLEWELRYRLVPERFRSERFPSFRFGDEKNDCAVSSGFVDSGTFDASGNASVLWKVDTDMRPASVLRAFLELSVMEASGRRSGCNASSLLFPAPVQLGVVPPSSYLKPGVKTDIRVAAVDSDDNPLDGLTLDVDVCRVTERYVMVKTSSGTRMKWQEELSEPEKFKIPVNSGRGVFGFLPTDEGVYQILLRHGKGHASLRVYVWNDYAAVSSGAVMPDRVNLKCDKASYVPGDTVSLRIKSPFEGRAVLSFGGIIPETLMSFEMTEREKDISFPFPLSAVQGGWLTVSVVRPEGLATKPPYRALGAMFISSDMSGLKLNVKPSVPESSEPGVLKTVLHVTDCHGKPVDGTVSLSLVDRGIYLLSGEKKVNPWEFFTRRREFGGMWCDIYDSLLPLESRASMLLHPAGGDGSDETAMSAGMLSPVRAVDYKPLSLWFPDVKIENGTAELECVIPEFSGELGITAVAVSGRSMGMGSASTRIVRPVVIDAALPRYAAPGDLVKAAVNITAEASGRASISVTPGDALMLNRAGDPVWKTVAGLQAGKRFNVSEFLPLMCVNSENSGSLKVDVTQNGRSYDSSASVTVRPGSAPAILRGGGRVENGETVIDVPDSWFGGTADVTLSLAGAPVVDASALLEYIDFWGWGIRRDIANGWVALNLPSLLKGGDAALSNAVERRIMLNTAVADLAAYQLYDGSFGFIPGGVTDPWMSVAALHLLSALKRADSSLPCSGLSQGMSWLRKFMNSTPDGDDHSYVLNARAYGCFVLAADEEPPLAQMHLLKENRKNLDSSGKALLAAAFAAAGDRKSAEELLGGEMRTDPEALDFPGDAFRLLALNTLSPGGADALNLASVISRAVERKDVFACADEAGAVLMALGDFAASVPDAPVRAELHRDGEKVAAFTGQPVSCRFKKGGRFSLKVDGSGSLWYSWAASGIPLKETAPYGRGIAVERKFTDENGNPVNLEDLPFGSKVIMHVTVTPDVATDLLRVAILFPGCLEAENAGKKAGDGDSEVLNDLRLDRLLLMCRGKTEGFSWEIPFRVVYRGTYTVPGISVDAPGNRGIGYFGKSGEISVF